MNTPVDRTGPATFNVELAPWTHVAVALPPVMPVVDVEVTVPLFVNVTPFAIAVVPPIETYVVEGIVIAEFALNFP